MESFAWFESTGFSTWVRESPPVFPTLLVMHALSMGVVVGLNVFAAWCLLANRTQVLKRFLPVLWTGVAGALVSGGLLVVGYPAKALTNPLFFAKLTLIAFGLVAFQSVASGSWRSMRGPHWQMIVLLALWFGATTAGRLLAYTHHVLLASHLVP